LADLPDSYFEPSSNELKAAYQAQLKAREALNNAPLKTQQIREREHKAKLDRWPNVRPVLLPLLFINVIARLPSVSSSQTEHN
jgi:hypothetical protein